MVDRREDDDEDDAKDDERRSPDIGFCDSYKSQ